MKPYTSRAGCSRFARAAVRRAPGNGEPPRPCRRARRPSRLPRVRPGKPRKPPAPRRPATCPPRAAAPATRPLCASRGQARPCPASRRRPEGTPRLPAPKAPAVPPGIAPVPRRPGKSPPASGPPRHTTAFSPHPPGSGTAAARAAVFRCAPKGGSNPWAVPAGDRGPLSREFSQNSGVGVLAPKQKKTAPKDDLWWYSQWLFKPVIAGAFAAAFSCQFAGCDQLAKSTLDGADTQ